MKSNFDRTNFILINKKIDGEILKSCFFGLLDNLKILLIDDMIVIKYNNKNKIYIEEIYDILSDDVGLKFLIFKGFVVDDYDDLIFIITLVKQYMKNHVGVYNISELIKIITRKENYYLSKLKNIIFKKYLIDKQFNLLVHGLFDNDLNVSKTAKELYMHRNTINNKLDCLFKDTGIDLTKFKDAIAVYELFK